MHFLKNVLMIIIILLYIVATLGALYWTFWGVLSLWGVITGREGAFALLGETVVGFFVFSIVVGIVFAVFNAAYEALASRLERES